MVAPQQTTQRQRTETQVIAFLAAMGARMAFGIDASLPAFDEIRPAFGMASNDTRVTLIITTYFIGMSFGQIFYGPLADRFGRAPILRFGLMLYMVGALFAMVATDFTFLLGSRLIWGFGAAAASVLRTTITRDLYHGDQMARIISITMAFFLLGPIVAPLIGEGLINFGSWRWPFGASAVLAIGMLFWSYRFGETLNPANQRPLKLGPTVEAIKKVTTTRVTVVYTLAMTLSFGAFFVYLASAQPIFDVIYGRVDWFPLLFAASGVIEMGAFFVVPRFIVRYGTHRVALISLTITLAISLVLLFFTWPAQGTPNFWIWFVGVMLANIFIAMLIPVGMAQALEPMEELAGTASGIIGLVTMGGATVIAGFINAQLAHSVTPMIMSYVVLSGVSLVIITQAYKNLET